MFQRCIPRTRDQTNHDFLSTMNGGVWKRVDELVERIRMATGRSNLIGSLMKLSVFLVIGALSLVLYVVAFRIFGRYMPKAIALGLAYFLGLLFNFVCNRNLTFRRPNPERGAWWRYLVLVTINATLAMLISSAMLKAQWPDWLSLGVGIAATTAFGFFASTYWVYAGRR